MKRMFLYIEKAQKFSETTKFEEKRAAAGSGLKSSPILGHPLNSFFDPWQAISK